MIHKHRNPVILKSLFQIVSIYIHITDDHTDISVSVLIFTYQSADSLCHCICFLSWVPCCMDFQILHSFIIPSRPVPEDISLQKCKFLVLFKSFHRISIQADRFFYLYMIFPRHSDQCRYHLLTQSKQLIWMFISIRILPFIHRNCHPDFLAAPHKFQYQPVLHRCKSGKSVKNYNTVFQKF